MRIIYIYNMYYSIATKDRDAIITIITTTTTTIISLEHPRKSETE